MPNLFCDLDDFVPGGVGGMGPGEWFIHCHGGPFGASLYVANQDGDPPSVAGPSGTPRDSVDIQAVNAWIAARWVEHGSRASGPMPVATLAMWPMEADILARAAADVRHYLAGLHEMATVAHYGAIIHRQASRTLAVNEGQRRPLTDAERAERDGDCPAYRSCLWQQASWYGVRTDLWRRACDVWAQGA